MTEMEFQDWMAYAQSLWPRFALNEEQGRQWFTVLRRHDLNASRRAVATLFRQSKYGLKLPELRELLRKDIDTRKQVVRAQTGEEAAHNALVLAEEAEEREFLSHWSDADYENSKAEVLRKEPPMEVFARLPARGKWWTHMLYRRYVLGAVVSFATGEPIEIPVEDWWRQIAQAFRKGPLASAMAPGARDRAASLLSVIQGLP